MRTYPVVTISREYGSGGHEIGELLAKKLELPFYDNELIAIAAKDSGIAEKYFDDAEQSATNSFSYALSLIGTSGQYGMPLNNQLFMIQSGLIRTIADRGPAVFVGRCADYVLKDYTECINIFIQSSTESKIQCVMARDKLSRKDAQSRISRIDKGRATYYNFYTNGKWGNRRNFHLVLDSSNIPAETVAELLVAYVNAVVDNRHGKDDA